jgi:hypothetical protein
MDRGWDDGRVGRVDRWRDGGRVDRRPWRRHFRYGFYSPWYGSYPYWGIGTGYIAGAAYPYYDDPYYDDDLAYDEPECVEIRRRVWTGREWRVRVVTQCS